MSINEEHPPEKAASENLEQESGTPEVPEAYRGKSAAELARIIEEKEKFIQRQANEIGDVRKVKDDLDTLRNELAFLREGRTNQGWTGGRDQFAQREETVDDDGLSDTDVLAAPKKAIDRIIDSKLKRLEAEQQKREQQRSAQEAQAAFLEGQTAFANQHPELFRGVEKEVSNMVWAALSRGAITPWEVRNPLAWKTSAQFVHLNKGNVELLIGKPTAVKPTETQKPSRARPEVEEEDEDAELDLTDPEVHKIMENFGVKSVEDAKKIIKAEQKKVRSGENKPRTVRTGR